MEVLARAVDAQLCAEFLTRGPVSAEFGEICEETEERNLLAHHVDALSSKLVASGEVLRQC